MKIADLQRKFPFPIKKPDVEKIDLGWCLVDEIQGAMNGNETLIIEIGSFLGRSARMFCDMSSNCKVVCIDRWELVDPNDEDIIGKNINNFKYIMNNMYDIFIANCWEYRDRIIPVKEDGVVGLMILRDLQVEPDFIFVDGDHDEGGCSKDLAMCAACFPRTKILGHDWSWPGVKVSAEYIARTKNYELRVLNRNSFLLTPRSII